MNIIPWVSFAVVISEFYLLLRWNVKYFSFGIPFYIQRINSSSIDNTFLSKIKEKQHEIFHLVLGYNKYSFKKISQNEIAMRGRGYYFFLIRGRIIIENDQIKLIGYGNFGIIACMFLITVEVIKDLTVHSFSGISLGYGVPA